MNQGLQVTLHIFSSFRFFKLCSDALVPKNKCSRTLALCSSLTMKVFIFCPDHCNKYYTDLQVQRVQDDGTYLLHCVCSEVSPLATCPSVSHSPQMISPETKCPGPLHPLCSDRSCPQLRPLVLSTRTDASFPLSFHQQTSLEGIVTDSGCRCPITDCP